MKTGLDDYLIKHTIEDLMKLPQIKTNFNISPVDFVTVTEKVKKWLLIKDKGIIKVICGIVIANKLDGDPVWGFIVNPSGGTKTELIRGLNKIEGIYPLSDLTAQTFISGDKGNKNSSLLLRLPENTILTYKDFTTDLPPFFRTLN